MDTPHAQQRHGRSARVLTVVLLVLWFAVSFVLPWFARDLDFDFFGWPFSFWMGAQGALLVYCLINACYAAWMRRLDAENGVANEAED